MQVQQSIKRLDCQHIFHKNCLRSWFQRQQACPICRTTVLRSRVPGTPNTPAGAAAAAAAATPQQQTQTPNAGASPTGTTSPSSSTMPPPPSTSTSPMFNFPPFNPTTAQNASSVTMSQMPFNSFPMVLPPFAFPPPPLPPLNFAGMSEVAIRAMEGTELAHVQTRIQCLRNVRSLLDASIIQMEQYMNIVSTQ
ncbi:unnamed protein product, partial [Rotaria magnacalcarata]